LYDEFSSHTLGVVSNYLIRRKKYNIHVSSSSGKEEKLFILSWKSSYLGAAKSNFGGTPWRSPGMALASSTAFLRLISKSQFL